MLNCPRQSRGPLQNKLRLKGERRAKIINAEGEFQASEKLAEAAKVLSEFPISIQLRFLQTLREISTEQNSTIIFPFPIDLVSAFLDKAKKVNNFYLIIVGLF